MVAANALKTVTNSAAYRHVLRPFVSTAARTMGRAGADDVPLVAGGVAFYAFLSIFPAIAFALMLWGLFTTPEEIRGYFDLLSGVVPDDAFQLISAQMLRISNSTSAGLSWGALITAILALWSASRAMNALLLAISITYHRPKRRGLIVQNAMALGFTAGGILFALISVAAIGAVPPILEALQLGDFIDALLRIVRWLGLIGLFLGGIYVFFRFARPRGADAEEVRRRPILPGAITAAVIWLLGSIAFSFYLGNFADYNETFGSLGAVAALLMWLWLSAYAICLGAETNGVLGREGSSKDLSPGEGEPSI